MAVACVRAQPRVEARALDAVRAAARPRGSGAGLELAGRGLDGAIVVDVGAAGASDGATECEHAAGAGLCAVRPGIAVHVARAAGGRAMTGRHVAGKRSGARHAVRAAGYALAGLADVGRRADAFQIRVATGTRVGRRRAAGLTGLTAVTGLRITGQPGRTGQRQRAAGDAGMAGGATHRVGRPAIRIEIARVADTVATRAFPGRRVAGRSTHALDGIGATAGNAALVGAADCGRW